MIKALQRKFIKSAMLAVTLLMAVFLIAINAADYYVAARETRQTLALILADESFQAPAGGPGGPGNGDSAGGPGGPADAAVPQGMMEPPEGADSLGERPELPEGVPGAMPEGMLGDGSMSAPEPPEGAAGDGMIGAPGAMADDGSMSAPEPPEGVPGDGAMSVPEAPEDSAREEALAGERYFTVRVTAEGRVIYTDLSHITSLDETEAAEIAEVASALDSDRGSAAGYSYAKLNDKAEGGSVIAFVDESKQTRTLLRVLILTLLVGAVCWVLILLLVIYMSRRAILPIAESIERQKQFVTDAGHEIKTPLAIIRANADVLELHGGSNKWLDNIRAQTDRLNLLTQSMLTLSRMEEGDGGAPAAAFDGGAAMKEILMTFREPAEMRGIRIEETIPGDVILTFQKDAYTRLLSVLFDNAIKYASEGGFLRVSLAREGKETVIRMRNSCDELPGDDPQKLFDRFYRADKARTRKTGGSGIGLSVARAIAESTGGSIRADYEDGNVIAFTVRLRDAGVKRSTKKYHHIEK